MTEEQSSLIKTPKQLIVVVLLAFAVPIALSVLISQLVTSGEHGTHDDNLVLARIAPVGRVVLAEASGPKGMLTGEQVYGQVCKTCHEAGLAGAHKLGDKAAWANVVAQGEKLSFEHAINGIRAMPARGGNSDLTDDEMKRAVSFMMGKVGTTWTSPAVAAAPVVAAAAAVAAPAAVAVAAAPAAAAPAAAVVAAAPAAAAAKPDGKKIYETGCVACHGAGVAGAPKFGDKAAWAPRIKTGIDALYVSTIKGKGVMPAKGGNPSLSDADVKAAVDFMVAAAK